MGQGRKKGTPKTGGKVIGSKNKVMLPDVAAILAEKGINPVNRLIEIAQSGTLKPHQEAAVWQTLLEYTAPKPKLDDKQGEQEINPADAMPDDLLTQSLRAAYANRDSAPAQ